jgi:16S rRNA processing protein RimM
VRPDGTPLGEVVAVHNFGAGDVIEVQLAGSLETVLVPFTREAVPEVDVAPAASSSTRRKVCSMSRS